MQAPIRVSFIIAARDEQFNIVPCIESVLRVMTSSDEVILVNDGSLDATQSRAESISDPRLVILRNEVSEGRAASRNAAILRARGKYLAIQDADDIALSTRLEALTLLERDPKLVAAGGQCVAMDPRFGAWRHTHYPEHRNDVRRAFNSGVMAICHTGSLLRRESVVSVGMYNPNFTRAQDLDLMIRLSNAGDIESIPQDVVIYTHNVLLPWRYWKSSRDNHDRVIGRAPLSPMKLVARYLAANAKRTAVFAITHRTSKRRITEMRLHDRPS